MRGGKYSWGRMVTDCVVFVLTFSGEGGVGGGGEGVGEGRVNLDSIIDKLNVLMRSE